MTSCSEYVSSVLLYIADPHNYLTAYLTIQLEYAICVFTTIIDYSPHCVCHGYIFPIAVHLSAYSIMACDKSMLLS